MGPASACNFILRLGIFQNNATSSLSKKVKKPRSGRRYGDEFPRVLVHHVQSKEVLHGGLVEVDLYVGIAWNNTHFLLLQQLCRRIREKKNLVMLDHVFNGYFTRY